MEKLEQKDLMFNDIYFIMRKFLLECDLTDTSIEYQKKIVDDCLKKYTIYKLQELNANKMISENVTKKLNMVDLFETLASMIPKEKHFDTLRFYTHYILDIACPLQGRSITWWSDEEQKEVEASFNEEGKWDKLNTPLNEDYVNTFKFVYDVFQNNFMVKNPVKKITNKSENN